jgi:hypothetical protein
VTAIRLAVATFAVLLPGLILARALGRVSAASTLVCALTLVFGAMLVVFATESSLTLALWLLLAAGVGLLPLALRPRPRLPERGWLLVLGAGVVFGGLLWFMLAEPSGDALFHLGRVRKLASFDELSLERVGEFADGGLHPGYAFPLWHGFIALVAKLAGVDPSVAIEREAAVLAPVTFLVVYEAGRELFRSAWLGGATLAATVALAALSAGSGGSLRSLALPATAGRQLLVPAALALLFAYLNEPTRSGLVLVALGAFISAVVHPTYALFVLLLVGGFLLVRTLVTREDLAPLAKAFAAMTLAVGAFLLWLFPVVQGTESFTPTNEQLTDPAHGIERYEGQIDFDSPNRYRLAPEVVSRAGAVPVAALALLPIAALAVRRRWAAFVLGSTLAVLVVVLTPFLFPLLVDAVSLSQARRLAGFIPFALALVGGAAVLARLLSYAVLPVALAAGIVVRWAFPGDFGYFLRDGGPPLVVWLAGVGGAVTLALVLALRRPGLALDRGDWLPFAATVLFVLPVAIASSWERPERATELTPALVDAVRRDVPEGAVVLADPETSYWLAAETPVYVAVAPPAHVGDTEDNRPYERVEEWRRFLRTGEFAGRAEWVVLDRLRVRRRICSAPVFADDRYVLCPRSRVRKSGAD